ncbi:Uncharacterised protein [Segatella copri]|nr:Uncharacterised protein [Segatella copri]
MVEGNKAFATFDGDVVVLYIINVCVEKEVQV